MSIEFTAFPKIARLSREIVVTEKLDGTNAAIRIIRHDTESEAREAGAALCSYSMDYTVEEGSVRFGPFYTIHAQSRSRFITPENDNFGFARWVKDHGATLVSLGEGIHFGEWWGSGIQRGYGLPKGEKRFSLFNTRRWAPANPNYEGEPVLPTASEPPSCCGVVPIIHVGPFDQARINGVMSVLQTRGSYATPFMNPEGIMIFHTAASTYFKKTFEGDEAGKEAA